MHISHANSHTQHIIQGEICRNKNENEVIVESESNETNDASLEGEQTNVKRQKRQPSLGNAVSNLPKLVKSRSRELMKRRLSKEDINNDAAGDEDDDQKSIGSVASRASSVARRIASRAVRPIRHRLAPKPEGGRIVQMASPGGGKGDTYVGSPKRNATNAAALAGNDTSKVIGFGAFAGRGGFRRKNYIAANLAAQSFAPLYTINETSEAEDDKPFVIRKEEKHDNEQFTTGALLGCGLIEIDDESRHGDQMPTTLYSSYREDTNAADQTVDEDDMVEHGAYDDYEWTDLPDSIRNAAILLGYCKTSWDEGQDVALTSKTWNELTSDEKLAATRLGYNEQFWGRPSSSDHHAEALDTDQLNAVIRGRDTFWAVLRFDKESRKIAKIAVPTTVETMIGTTLSAVQLAFISKYLGSDALAVFGIVGLAMSLTEIIGAGIGAAEEIMVAQSIGAGDYYRAGSIVQLTVCLYMLLAIPVYSFWIYFIHDFALYFELGDAVAELAKAYIPIMSLYHFVRDGFSDTLGGLMRIDGKAWQMSIIDTAFSALHIIGIVVGIVRFDIGLVQVAWIEVASSLLYGMFMYSFCACMGWLKSFQKGLFDMKGIQNGTLAKELVCTAIPLCLSELLASGEWHILTLYAAHIGDVAAWTVAGAIWDFFEQSPEGIGAAAIIRIGYHLGQANPRQAKISAYKSLLACLGWSATLTTIFMCQSNTIIAFFTDDEYITSAIEGAVVLIGAGNCVMCIGNLSWTILSAQSRPKIPAWVYGGVGVAGICIPLASTFTFKLNFDITGLVAAIVISYATVSAMLLVFIFTSNWTKICCRIISAYSGVTFVAVDDDTSNGNQKWQPSKEEQEEQTPKETTFALKKELDLV